MSLSAEEDLLVMLVGAVKRGDDAHAQQLATMAIATGLAQEVVDGIVALGNETQPVGEDRERLLARELELPLLGEIDGRPAPLTPAAQRALGVGFPGSLEEAIEALTGIPADTPGMIDLIHDARTTGKGGGTLRHGRARCRIAAWTTDQGQLRVLAVSAGGDDVRELETLATVNHEMANGLTALASLAALARHPSSGPDQIEDLLRRIEEIARDTLGAVKSTRKALGSRPPSELPPFDVAPLLRDLLTSVEPTAREAGVLLEARVIGELVVQLRPTDLRSVVWNLVKNAIEAVSGGGTVQVAAQAFDTKVRIIVRDDGPGMDEETQARAFDPFFTTKSEGSGLGLPLVKHLVERTGGELIVESRPGEGTRIVVSLPRSETLSGVQPISAVRARSRMMGMRALVVGSEARSMAEGLRSQGALLEDVRSTIDAGVAIDLAIVGGMQGTMMISALRPLAECIVWIGSGGPDDDLVDARIDRPRMEALLTLIPELYPERVAV